MRNSIKCLCEVSIYDINKVFSRYLPGIYGLISAAEYSERLFGAVWRNLGPAIRYQFFIQNYKKTVHKKSRIKFPTLTSRAHYVKAGSYTHASFGDEYSSASFASTGHRHHGYMHCAISRTTHVADWLQWYRSGSGPLTLPSSVA